MNNDESIYVNIDLNGLVTFFEDCDVPRETIELIVDYCKKRMVENVEPSDNYRSYEL